MSAFGLAGSDADGVADGLAATVVGAAEAAGVADAVVDTVAAGVAMGVATAEFGVLAAVGFEVSDASGGFTAHPPKDSTLARAPTNTALDTPVTTNEGTRRSDAVETHATPALNEKGDGSFVVQLIHSLEASDQPGLTLACDNVNGKGTVPFSFRRRGRAPSGDVRWTGS